MIPPSEAQSLRDAVADVIRRLIKGRVNADGSFTRAMTCSPEEAVITLLSPRGPIGAHIAKIEAERDAAEANAFTLAANQCEGPMVGDDHGHFYCAQVATLTARLAEVEAERAAAHAKGRAEAIGEAVKVAEAHSYTGRGTEGLNNLIGTFARGNLRAKEKIARALRALLPTTGDSDAA